MSSTIDLGVKIAQENSEALNQEIHDGKVAATRKNPHVTNAGSRPSF
jgi:hypothetical protein